MNVANETKPTRQRPAERRRDPDRTAAEILRVATDEFAEYGYAGARINRIADATKSTKRMIYYYFGSKDGLYRAVLEAAYSEQRALEQEIGVADLDPVAAIRSLAEFAFDYDDTKRNHVRLVATENIARATQLRRIERPATLGNPIVKLIDDVLSRGRRDGVFVREATALEVHIFLTALSFYRVANGPTISMVLGYDADDPANRARYRRAMGDLMVAWLCTADPEPAADRPPRDA